MIINHNLMANNAIRNMNINSGNSSKAMQKLSSGLRINSAADDAAGLAISEKMRGQINGLDQASSNAQDSISMVQTAEGALNETTSILQRMKQLATQSANDTNVGDDRTQIQTEMNQLTSEINRIGNTTEFNTQKVLNGGSGQTANIRYSVMASGDPATGSATGAVSTMNTAVKSVKAGTVAVSSLTTVANSRLAATSGTIGSPLTEMTASTKAGTADMNKSSTAGAAAATAFTGAVTGITNFAAGAKDEFTVDFASALTGKAEGSYTSVSIGGQNYSFKIGANDTASVANLANAIKADITANAAQYTNLATTDVVASGTQITFTGTAVNTAMKIGTYTDDGTNTQAEVQAAIKTGGTAGTYTYEFKSQFTAGDKVTINGQDFVAKASGASGANEFNIGADLATSVANLKSVIDTNAAVIDADHEAAIGSASWTADTNSITITSTAAGAVDADAANYTGATVTPTAAVKGQYKFEIASNFQVGQKITIAGQDFTVRDASGTNDATGFKLGIDINETADNLLKAINANTTLSGKFDAANLNTGKDGSGAAVTGVTGTGLATDSDTIVLQEKTATGSNMATVVGANITVTNQAAVQGQYSFDVTKNFSEGDSVTIGSKTYKAGTAAEVAGGTAQFQVGTTVQDSVNNLVSKITADGLYTAVAGNSAFVNGNRITLTEVTASGTDLTGVSKTNTTEVDGKYEFLINTNLADKDRIAIGGVGLTAGTDFKVGADVNATAANIRAAIAANSELNAKFTVGADADNKITLTEKVAAGTDITAPSISAGAVAGKFEFAMNALSSGTKIKIDGTEIALTKGGTETETAAELKTLIEGNATLNAKYAVAVSGTDVTLTQKAGQESPTAPTLSYETQAGAGFKAQLQIGANTGQSMEIDLNDMRSLALGISQTSCVQGQTVEVDGKKFAVGWTTGSSVTNGTDNVKNEYALDISSHDNATAAVKVIDTAINTVSSERAKLGAYQNRLEHTINNLGTASENLTTAESRIRDVDMAKEMSNFSKNNILSQAAQAMLAQANQQPQQVLQLLR